MLQAFAWDIPADCDVFDAVTSGPQPKDGESVVDFHPFNSR